MSHKDKWVRRFSVDETARHKNGFTIYKITSVLFPINSPEAVTVVSVWKRYSDIQRLHKSMSRLHTGLHLRGTFPELARYSYFKRFQQQVIEERAKSIKNLLEFIAGHQLLFTSTDFVDFLQTGYAAPATPSDTNIAAIRTSLQLPLEDSPPLEYPTDDDDTRSPNRTANPTTSQDETDVISQIPIYEPTDIEMPPQTSNISKADSFDSIASLESIGSDLYTELDKIKVEKVMPSVKKLVLPDLINFDAPSTSKFEDYHTMNQSVTSINSIKSNLNSETSINSIKSNLNSETSINSIKSTLNSESVSINSSRSNSRVSVYKSVSSLSNVESKTKTEDSYVFEAGYMLNLAARYEDMEEYGRAFECYKTGIEKMLIGVQSDTDPHRRALIKEKTNKYLSYAENIYKNHLAEAQHTLLPEQDTPPRLHCPIPISMLRRPYEDLSLYRVIAVLGSKIMLVLHRGEQTCYAMKVLQKIPNNRTEFDEYFLQNTNETKQVILPTDVPYMVPLHSYIETNNLIFLILSYAPGEKLLDYIRNYTKSVPNTPAREVNLENVFIEPKYKNFVDESDVDILKTEALNLKIEEDLNKESDISIIDRIEQNIENLENRRIEAEKTESLDDMEMSVNELVINSQKILLNVDKALNDDGGKEKIEQDIKDKIDITVIDRDGKKEVSEVDGVQNKSPVERRIDSPMSNMRDCNTVSAVPPSAIRRWAAELLTAIESLHNTGVIMRDFNPSNILLGDRGQITLTYITGYPYEVFLSRLRPDNMYIAPELYKCQFEERDDSLERICDYWSYGAVLYELTCGVPLSWYHRSAFTAHTLLLLPDGLPLEDQSLLTQLLTYEPSERLGAGKDGIAEIKTHPYFRHIDWEDVYSSWGGTG